VQLSCINAGFLARNTGLWIAACGGVVSVVVLLRIFKHFSIMKKKLVICFIVLDLLVSMQGNANGNNQRYIIGDETMGGITVVPNDYMNAISVEIELILADGSTFAKATTSAGSPVSFNIAGAGVRLVRTIYHLNSLESIIIDDDTVIN
jgi:hypothetical protein